MVQREPSPIRKTLKKSACALREAGIEFALAGGMACWARGGPESDHDLDLAVRPENAEAALDALANEGMRPERPPEPWLFKAWDGDVMVDVIFEPAGHPVDDELLGRAEVLEVDAVPMRVMSAEDIIATKLLALSEHNLDYEGILRVARSLREQVDWDSVRVRTKESPFAAAFFTLAEGLGITPQAA